MADPTPAIPALEALVARLRSELTEAEEALRAARCEALGFSVGQVVMAKLGWNDAAEETIIRDLLPWSGRGGTVRVSRRKKNGDWSKVAHYANVLDLEAPDA